MTGDGVTSGFEAEPVGQNIFSGRIRRAEILSLPKRTARLEQRLQAEIESRPYENGPVGRARRGRAGEGRGWSNKASSARRKRASGAFPKAGLSERLGLPPPFPLL